jgi:thiol-disulfide isomerase/thioredoxin
MQNPRTVHLFAALAMLALVALAGGVAACGSSSSSSSSSQSSAVPVRFIAVDEFDLGDYAGKPLVVNYFGSWCAPCNIEAPELASWARSHPDAQIVGVAVEDTEDTVTTFMNEYGLTYPVVMDTDWSNANENGVTGVPETLFYDAAGAEVDRIIGATTEAQLDLSYAKASQ